MIGLPHTPNMERRGHSSNNNLSHNVITSIYHVHVVHKSGVMMTHSQINSQFTLEKTDWIHRNPDIRSPLIELNGLKSQNIRAPRLNLRSLIKLVISLSDKLQRYIRFPAWFPVTYVGIRVHLLRIVKVNLSFIADQFVMLISSPNYWIQNLTTGSEVGVT